MCYAAMWNNGKDVEQIYPLRHETFSPIRYYSYGRPNFASANTKHHLEEKGVSQSFFYDDGTETSIFFIFDKFQTGSGGAISAKMTSTGLVGKGVSFRVQDDPGESQYVWNDQTGSSEFSWGWAPCCTDGMVLGPLPRPPTMKFPNPADYQFCLNFNYGGKVGVDKFLVRSLTNYWETGARIGEKGKNMKDIEIDSSDVNSLQMCYTQCACVEDLPLGNIHADFNSHEVVFGLGGGINLYRAGSTCSWVISREDAEFVSFYWSQFKFANHPGDKVLIYEGKTKAEGTPDRVFPSNDGRDWTSQIKQNSVDSKIVPSTFKTFTLKAPVFVQFVSHKNSPAKQPGFSLSYVIVPVTISAVPNNADKVGGAVILISAKNLIDPTTIFADKRENPIRCKFGSKIITAEWVSETRVKCEAPAWIDTDPNWENTVPLALSNDRGLSWSNTIPFKYNQEELMCYAAMWNNGKNVKKIFPLQHQVNGAFMGAVEYYSYSKPNAASANTPHGLEKAETTNYFLYDDGSQTSFFVIFDKAGDGSGGYVKANMETDGLVGKGIEFIVKDDPGEQQYAWDDKTGSASFNFGWVGCCTDGMVLGNLPRPVHKILKPSEYDPLEASWCFNFKYKQSSGVSTYQVLSMDNYFDLGGRIGNKGSNLEAVSIAAKDANELKLCYTQCSCPVDVLYDENFGSFSNHQVIFGSNGGIGSYGPGSECSWLIKPKSSDVRKIAIYWKQFEFADKRDQLEFFFGKESGKGTANKAHPSSSEPIDWTSSIKQAKVTGASSKMVPSTFNSIIITNAKAFVRFRADFKSLGGAPGFTLHYVVVPRLITLTPAATNNDQVPVQITLKGTNFIDTAKGSNLVCKLGSKIVKATFINDKMATCSLSSFKDVAIGNSKTIAVSISNDGITFSNTQNFEFSADCVITEWSEWSDCSEECGPGKQTRERSKTEGIGSGKKCGNSPLVDTQNCNDGDCGPDCIWADWTEWGGCQEDCRRIRISYFVKRVPPQTSCGENFEIDQKECLDNCQLDCVWDEWSVWNESGCDECLDADSAEKEKIRTRGKKVEALNGGVLCEGPEKETKPCDCAKLGDDDFSDVGDVVGPSNTSDVSPDDNDDSSRAWIAGVVIGSVAGAILIAGIGYYVVSSSGGSGDYHSLS